MARCVEAEYRQALTAFVWWTAWSATTERPGGDSHIYEQLAARAAGGQYPALSLLMWTVFSVLFLIAGIALLGWHHARHKDEARAGASRQ